jgi:hypothetical protein
MEMVEPSHPVPYTAWKCSSSSDNDNDSNDDDSGGEYEVARKER